jgi:predicted nucleic acid-binding protein
VCLIVDANAASMFLSEPSAIRDWLSGATDEPRLVAGGLLRKELAALTNVRKFLVELERAGRLRSADAEHLGKVEARLRSEGLCVSNDSHVLALAIVSGARSLATFDNALASDFKSAKIIDRPRGSVYRDPDIHGHLLGHTPSSCGVKPTAIHRKRGRK